MGEGLICYFPEDILEMLHAYGCPLVAKQRRWIKAVSHNFEINELWNCISFALKPITTFKHRVWTEKTSLPHSTPSFKLTRLAIWSSIASEVREAIPSLEMAQEIVDFNLSRQDGIAHLTVARFCDRQCN